MSAGQHVRNTIRSAWLGLATLSVLSCGDSLSPLSNAESPRELTVQAMGVGAVRLTWKAASGATTYRVLRRVDQQGEFETLPVTVAPAPDVVTYVDTDVEPETFYGYRVVSVTSHGDVSVPSITGGTRTPPPPGILITTQSESPTAAALDPDGYRVTLTGPDTVSAVIGLAAERRFAPLRPGTYRAVLRGVVSRCDVMGDSVRTVVVADTGLHTLTPIGFHVRCRDQTRGRVVTIVAASGDSADANGFDLRITGVADDATLPDSLRIITLAANLSSSGGTNTFENLRPGSYEIELRGLATQCTSSGQSTVTIAVKAAATDTARFAVVCEARRSEQLDRPLVWRNTWSLVNGAPQQKVYLDIALDATSRTALFFAAVQSELRYDETVLRYEKTEASPAGGLDGIIANLLAPGHLAFGSVDNAGHGFHGVVPLGRIEFTVIGGAGSRALTRTSVVAVTTNNIIEYADSTRIVEDTLHVAGATAKQPPVASAHGPYSGVVGTPVTFTSSGSNDPDGGSITYRWTFGDGSAESTDAAPTKSYAATGTYSVTLTVTDDEGVAATAQTTATITAGGSQTTKPLVWRNSWSSATASPQEKVLLTVAVDAAARPQVKLAAIQSELRYDATILRFEKAQGVPMNGLSGLTTNSATAGVVIVGSTDNNGVGLSGLVGVVQIEFTVIGAAGSHAVTQTTLTDVTDPNLIAYVDSTSVVEATLTVGSGGAAKQPPVATINGPYSGTAGTPITFSAAGSHDPDGGNVTYRWSFGDGSADATGASPVRTFASVGTYSVTLTVTDDEGVSASAQTTATIAASTSAKPLLWSYTFGSVNAADSVVVMNVSCDLSADVAETPGAESLESWAVDSLRWNPAVLKFFAFNFGPGGGGSVSQSSTTSGKLSFRGTPSANARSGIVTIATIRFKVIGQPGQSSATQTWLGPLLGPSSFQYNSKTAISEATFVVP